MWRSLSRCACVVSVLCVSGISAASASADPLTVLGFNPHGSVLVFDFEGDFFRFAGTTFGVNGGDLGHFFPRVPQTSCDPRCAPGEVLNLDFRTPGDVVLGHGNASINGRTFSDVAIFGSLSFDADPLIFPNPADDLFRLSSPFTFSGTVRGVAGTSELFSLDLIGSGLVTQNYARLDDGSFILDDEGRRDYFFLDPQVPTPTPEPATLVLTALGLAGVARVRQRQARG